MSSISQQITSGAKISGFTGETDENKSFLIHSVAAFVSLCSTTHVHYSTIFSFTCRKNITTELTFTLFKCKKLIWNGILNVSMLDFQD